MWPTAFGGSVEAMTSTTSTTTSPTIRSARTDRAGAAFLLVAGVAYFVGGGLHPKGGASDETKLEQLRVMFLDDRWYPSHALLLLSMACFAVGLIAIRRRGGLPHSVTRVLGAAAVIACIATAAMLLHLFAATQEAAIRDGDPTMLIRIHTWSETLVAPLFGLGIAALAVVGGLSRTLGNRVVLVFGLVGGLCYALAAATIAYTDRFDFLFAISSTIGVWAAAVGLLGLLRR